MLGSAMAPGESKYSGLSGRPFGTFAIFPLDATRAQLLLKVNVDADVTRPKVRSSADILSS